MNLATEEKPEQETTPDETRAVKLGGTDIFRGALVIVTAIVIGGFVISRGLGDDATGESSAPNTTIIEVTEGEAADGGPESTLIDDTQVLGPATETAEAETAEAGATTEETVPAAPVLRSPAEVKVLVLNGAQTQGIAARGTEALLAANYKTAAPKNAVDQRPSAVLYTEGYEAEAVAVAAVFGVGLESLAQPLDLANMPIDDTQESNVIVVIGPDSAIPIP